MNLKELIEVIPSYQPVSYRLIDDEFQRIYQLYPLERTKKKSSQTYVALDRARTEYPFQELLKMEVDEISSYSSLCIEIVIRKKRDVEVPKEGLELV